ncbi:hypothetical protein [Reichenbachiella sp.]
MNQKQKINSEQKAEKSNTTQTKQEAKISDLDIKKMSMVMQLVCW